MKRFLVGALLLSFCLPASLYGQSLLPGGFPSLSALTENVKVNPYVQVGFEWLGSNLTLPVQNQPLPVLPLNIGDLEISLRDANFWAGTAGISISAYEKYSLFASAGGLLNRPFITAGTIPASLNGVESSANLQFTNTNVEIWSIQTGIGLGPIILGLYWDHFAFALGEPRNQAGPVANQTLRGDILARTFCPFAGLSVSAVGAVLTITYSPWAYSNVALSLTSSQSSLTQLRYTWKKPGDLLNVMLQYNTPVSRSVSLGLWSTASWLRMSQTAELDFQSSTPLLARSKDVTATMTKYLIGAGVALAITF